MSRRSSSSNTTSRSNASRPRNEHGRREAATHVVPSSSTAAGNASSPRNDHEKKGTGAPPPNLMNRGIGQDFIPSSTASRNPSNLTNEYKKKGTVAPDPLNPRNQGIGQAILSSSAAAPNPSNHKNGREKKGVSTHAPTRMKVNNRGVGQGLLSSPTEDEMKGSTAAHPNSIPRNQNKNEGVGEFFMGSSTTAPTVSIPRNQISGSAAHDSNLRKEKGIGKELLPRADASEHSHKGPKSIKKKYKK